MSNGFVLRSKDSKLGLYGSGEHLTRPKSRFQELNRLELRPVGHGPPFLSVPNVGPILIPEPLKRWLFASAADRKREAVEEGKKYSIDAIVSDNQIIETAQRRGGLRG